MKSLFNVIESGDINAVRTLLRAGADINVFDEGKTALMRAAASEHCDIAMLDFLLKNGADINARAVRTKLPALMFAVKNTDKFQFLMRKGAKVPRSPLCRPLPVGCTDSVRALLLTNGFELPVRLSTAFGGGAGRLDDVEDCAMMCRFEDVRKFESSGVSLAPLEWTPLMREIVLGDCASVARQLQLGADLKARDHRQHSPFLLSVLSGDVDKAKLIYAAGGSFEERGQNGISVLDCAIRSGSAVMLRWLCQEGVSIDLPGASNSPALHVALEEGHIDTVRLLIEQGADVFATDASGRQAIHYASHAETVEVLTQAGANLDAFDGEGSTPLLRAIDNRNIALVRALIEHGAGVHCGKAGYTPLHRATSYDDLVTMKLLLDNGANPEAVENLYYGFVPGDFVKSKEAEKLLRDAGAMMEG